MDQSVQVNDAPITELGPKPDAREANQWAMTTCSMHAGSWSNAEILDTGWKEDYMGGWRAPAVKPQHIYILTQLVQLRSEGQCLIIFSVNFYLEK